MATYLDRILAAHRAAAAGETRDLATLVSEAGGCAPARGFGDRLRAGRMSGNSAGDELAVIAEVKRRSPSRGVLAEGLDPARLARDYESGGASCLSVLTDAEFFGGSAADLVAARSACTIPVLRKDFTVSAHDVVDARLMGADCVLLITAALDDEELEALLVLARHVGLDALVEVHDEADLERAVSVGADLIGVNQRDLVTFEVDTERAARLAPLMPEGVVRVAESGIRGIEDASTLAAAGYHAVLVGESLVTSGDPAGAVAALRRAGVGSP